MSLQYRTPVYLRATVGDLVLHNICNTGRDPPELATLKTVDLSDEDILAVEFRNKSSPTTTGVITHEDTVEMFLAGTETVFRESGNNQNQVSWKCSGHYIFPADDNTGNRMPLTIRLPTGSKSSDPVLLGEEVAIGGNSGGSGGTGNTNYLHACYSVGQNCAPAIGYQSGKAQPGKSEFTTWIITETPNGCGLTGTACTNSGDCCNNVEGEPLICDDGECQPCRTSYQPCDLAADCCNGLCLEDADGNGVCAECLDDNMSCSLQGTDHCCKDNPSSCDPHSGVTPTCQPCLVPTTKCSPLDNCCAGLCEPASGECILCEGPPCTKSAANPQGCPCYPLKHPCTDNTNCESRYCRPGTGGDVCDNPDKTSERIDWWWWLLVGMGGVVLLLALGLYLRYYTQKKKLSTEIDTKTKKAKTVDKAKTEDKAKTPTAGKTTGGSTPAPQETPTAGKTTGGSTPAPQEPPAKKAKVE